MKKKLLQLHLRRNRKRIRHQLPLTKQPINKVSKSRLSLLLQRKLNLSPLVAQCWSTLGVMLPTLRLNR
jgi:hypothetical protein